MKSKSKRIGGGGGGDPFDFCDVCKLNHDQGRRHKYFPSHARSLSSLLCRFHKKIAALRSLLTNPAVSQPEHSHLDGIWCVFCGVDVRDNGSSFACSEHLTDLKDFLRKHGGGMDRVDSFRVSDDELIKGNIYIQGMPAMGSFSISLTGKQPMQLANSGKTVRGHSRTGGMESRNGYGGDCSRGSQANVHAGALPPWLDSSKKEISQPITGPHLYKLATSSSQTGKSRKLNPKRVGAAWADRERVELEMEKRGERVPNSFEANWLSNFGRVWQACPRRESKKEFEVEKRKFFKDNNQPDLHSKAQPYISKRMRTGSPNGDNGVGGRIEDCL